MQILIWVMMIVGGAAGLFVHGLSCFGYADNSCVEDFPQGKIPYSDL
mgnify:CR=1 FL=1